MSPPDSAHLHNVHRTSAPLAASWWKPDKTWRPRKNKCNRIKWPLRHSGEHQGRATWPPSSSCSFSKSIKFNSIGHQRNVEMNSINRRHCHHSLELIRLIILSVERWLNLHTSPAVINNKVVPFIHLQCNAPVNVTTTHLITAERSTAKFTLIVDPRWRLIGLNQRISHPITTLFSPRFAYSNVQLTPSESRDLSASRNRPDHCLNKFEWINAINKIFQNSKGGRFIQPVGRCTALMAPMNEMNENGRNHFWETAQQSNWIFFWSNTLIHLHVNGTVSEILIHLKTINLKFMNKSSYLFH